MNPARLARHAAVVALLACAGSALVFGARVEGYSHAQHPLALLGAAPAPQAGWFNVLAFVFPGLAAAAAAFGLRSALPAARWPARIGAQLMLLAALAFAAQGLLPLDAAELDGAQNGRHASAWMAWLIAAGAGGAGLASGLRRLAPWQGLARVSLAVAVFLPLFALVLPQLVPAGIAQRLAFLLWFGWTICAAMATAAPRLSRSAASSRGSPGRAPGSGCSRRSSATTSARSRRRATAPRRR